MAKSHDRRPCTEQRPPHLLARQWTSYRLRVAYRRPIVADSPQAMSLGQGNSRIHAMARVSTPVQCQHRAVRCVQDPKVLPTLTCCPAKSREMRTCRLEVPSLISLATGWSPNRVGPHVQTACGFGSAMQEGHLDRGSRTDTDFGGGQNDQGSPAGFCIFVASTGQYLSMEPGCSNTLKLGAWSAWAALLGNHDWQFSRLHLVTGPAQQPVNISGFDKDLNQSSQCSTV